MKSNVRNYTADQILERVMSHARGWTHYPSDFWLIGIRSNEDAFNEFDDKFYLFEGARFHKVFRGTTNAGSKGLHHFEEYNKNGVAVLQSDRIVYGSHGRGISKGREVFRQMQPWPYYRDGNKDNYADEKGKLFWDIIHAHIHDAKMQGKDEFKAFINGWSLACQVMNNGKEWDEFMELTSDQQLLTYCLLKEWDPLEIIR